MLLACFPWMIAVLATVTAAVTDVWKFRIPNWLTLPLLASGLLYHGVLEGTAGLATSGLGMLMGFALLLPLYVAGGMGAGDVKLLAGLGAWLKTTATLEILVFSCLLAGLYSLALLFGRRANRALEHGVDSGPGGLRVEDVHRREDRRGRLIPFGAMMAGGLVLSLIWSQSG